MVAETTGITTTGATGIMGTVTGIADCAIIAIGARIGFITGTIVGVMIDHTDTATRASATVTGDNAW